MIVYVDITAALNLAMNSIILEMTARIAGISCSVSRVCAGALLGAVLAVVGLLPEVSWLQSIPGKLLVSLLVVIAAFGRKPLHTFLPIIALFYLCSFLLGGAVFGWLCLGSQNPDLDPVRGNRSPWLELAIASCVAVALAFVAGRRFQGSWFNRAQSYQITIGWEGRSVTLTALLDSGNMLHTYWEQTPVIIVDYLALQPLFSKAVNAFLKENPADCWLLTVPECQDQTWLKRVRFIPYQTIGIQNMLLGFRPDSLTIHGKIAGYRTTDVIIALYGGVLSEVGSYSALLHPTLIRCMHDKEV